jgi:hypothetical protein
MARTKKSQAGLVKVGYGQVEPNHLSAQRTGQIYAQLPAAKGINILENGQFVKYDYFTNTVNFTGAGEWMLVFNEVKVYRDHESDCDFAMIKEDYAARVYSPMGDVTGYANARNYGELKDEDENVVRGPVVNAYEHDITSSTNPFVIEQRTAYTKMPEGTTMVPRVFKTNVGDIFTTNTVKEENVALGNILAPGADGILKVVGADAEAAASTEGMKWQVVKVYTLADRQPAVKIMRIA